MKTGEGGRREKLDKRTGDAGEGGRREKGGQETREVIFRLEKEGEGRKREEKKDAGLKNL
jgi:hypothetical protein